MVDEQYLIDGLQQGNKEAFSLLFKAYYKDLVLFGGNFLPDRDACEDIVQSIFLKLWDDRETFFITASLKSYLLKSVRNACLDEIRHLHIKQEYENNFSQYGYFPANDDDIEEYLLYSDLQTHLQKALAEVPEPSRKAFLLSRNEGLKYREIAEKLQVSERTVEVRISKVLELLRKHLKEFLAMLLLGLIY
ncbi:RNA polymerase sigma-70 factor [Bacteroidia bacterium]|nr:RNA polymerase sigma-70 factor [Bacteroidia bacterium]GHV48389.1 RNA polymerase sigma-70 factor [Bacteroidia bacterium]